MKYIKANKYFFYLLIAIFGSVIAIFGDFLIGYMTPGAIGKYGFIQIGWSELSTWRLSLSLFFASIAFVFYLLGIYVIKQQIARTSSKIVKLFYSAASGAVLGGLFIHVLFCAPMFVYKYLYDAGQPEMAIDIAYSVIFMMLPAAIITLILMVFAFVVLMIATFRKKTIYKRWCLLFNPLIIISLIIPVKSFFPTSPLALGISTSCINAGLMVFFITAAIYEFKANKIKSIKAAYAA